MRPNKRFLMNCEKKIPSAVSLFHVYKTFLTEKKTCSVLPAIHSFFFILLIAYQSNWGTINRFLLGPLASGLYVFVPTSKKTYFFVIFSKHCRIYKQFSKGHFFLLALDNNVLKISVPKFLYQKFLSSSSWNCQAIKYLRKNIFFPKYLRLKSD
jgi:hypothetical protein